MSKKQARACSRVLLHSYYGEGTGQTNGEGTRLNDHGKSFRSYSKIMVRSVSDA